jgi:hypothetical protein
MPVHTIRMIPQTMLKEIPKFLRARREKKARRLVAPMRTINATPEKRKS